MADTLAELQRFVGNSETAHDVITASQVGRLAVTLDVAHPAPNEGDAVPPGWHGVFFPSLVPFERLRTDGQPAGGVAPPVPLPRRRLVGVRGTYPDLLRIGDAVTKVTEVAAIEIEDFGAGPTARVTVRESITSLRGLAVVDERDVLYFGEDGPGEGADAPPVLPASAAWKRTCEPDPVQIFRLSAVRFNSHRIHYDRRYTTETEGYPGLVVPVTLVSFLMMELCRAEVPDRRLAAFSYRSEKPVFDLGPYCIFGAPDGSEATLWATDYENDCAVTATARFTG